MGATQMACVKYDGGKRWACRYNDGPHGADRTANCNIPNYNGHKCNAKEVHPRNHKSVQQCKTEVSQHMGLGLNCLNAKDNGPDSKKPGVNPTFAMSRSAT